MSNEMREPASSDWKDIKIVLVGSSISLAGFGLFFAGNYVGKEVGLVGAAIAGTSAVVTTLSLYLRNPQAFRSRLARTYDIDNWDNPQNT